MRDSRHFSSARWQLPHFRFTRSLVTGMPSSPGSAAAATACACCAASGVSSAPVKPSEAATAASVTQNTYPTCFIIGSPLSHDVRSPRDVLRDPDLPGADRHRWRARRSLSGSMTSEEHHRAADERGDEPGGAELLVHRVGLA